jgi:hypothetical protein
MIEPLQLPEVLDNPEIDPDARLVELATADRYPDGPVVPVEASAVAGIAPERVGRGEMGFDGYFENAWHTLSLPV